MAGTLYIVATPIGNLEDITQRGLRVLREVDLIACEDTRHTRKLLTHFGITTRTISYHEHNEADRTRELIASLAAGQQIALVSDAGTPLVSDPGFRLVAAAVENEIAVVPVPGVSAIITALSASGLPSDRFLFVGFLGSRSTTRRTQLAELRAVSATLVIYEAPHRVALTLKDARAILGNRRVVVARELTKLHEEFLRGTLDELIAVFEDSQKARGEIVIMISAAAASDGQAAELSASAGFIERLSQLQQEGWDDKAAFKKAAKELGLKRDEAYRLMVAQKNRRTR